MLSIRGAIAAGINSRCLLLLHLPELYLHPESSSRLNIITNVSRTSLTFPHFLLPRDLTRRNRSHCCVTLSDGGSEKRRAMYQQQGVVVRDSELLDKKKTAIREAGPSKLQVIADFDGTLTKYWIEGRRGQSSHGLLQQGNPEYDAKREALYNYYHPLEYSPTIPIEVKTKLMEECH